MSENTVVNSDAIAEAILKKLKAEHHTFWIDPEVHSQQHEFLKALIEERAEKKASRKKIEEMIAGSIILSAILGTIAVLGQGFIELMRSHLK